MYMQIEGWVFFPDTLLLSHFHSLEFIWNYGSSNFQYPAAVVGVVVTAYSPLIIVLVVDEDHSKASSNDAFLLDD